ncbi:sensor histidine kinase, partial [Amycolatopsis sp. NPDC000673]
MGTPAASLANARRRFEGADWVRWGVLAVPPLFAIPHARPWTWPLIGLILVLSVPALWLTRESKPRWLMPATMIAVVAAAGALWILQPSSWTSTTMFGAVFYTLRVSSRIAAAVALAVASAAILIWSIAYDLDWLNAVALFAILVVMVLLAINRRGRAERLEQTELALARAQTASEEHAR